jgi:hypothetical protein
MKSNLKRHFVSYPKSGRTWIRYILTRLKVNENILFHHDTFEFNDGSKPQPQLDFHQRLQRCKKVGKTVYLTRDPRDIIVSLFFQITGRFQDFFDYKGTISEFIRDDYFGATKLKLFRDQWEEICRAGLAYKVTYEQCHSNMTQVMRGLLNYYEIEYDEEVLARAVANATFEKMRHVEESRTFDSPWLQPRNHAYKMRKGKIGNFCKYLSNEDIAYLNDVFKIKNEGNLSERESS